MPVSAISTRMTGLTAFLAAMLMGVALFGVTSASADQMGIGEGPSGDYSFGSTDCTGGHADPVTVMFRGKRAGVSNVSEKIELYPGWEHDENAGPQGLLVKGTDGKYGCRETDASRASEPEFSLDGPEDRFHVRLWFIPATGGTSEIKTVGTPHEEDWIEYNPLDNHCTGVAGVGSHAVEKGGEEPGDLSGFDDGRRAIKKAFARHDHKVRAERWGNDSLFEQCDGDKAGSNGWGVMIWVNRGMGASMSKATGTKATSSTLNGKLTTEEATTEWWFAYGTKPSQGVSGYPDKTAVKSISGNAQVGVSAPVSKLKPNTKYYARMFLRNQDGEIEEGNEIEYSTHGPPIAAWSFDKGEGTLAEDSAGSHDGTIEGATWVRGKFGGALTFDGTNDCVSVPESVELQFLADEEFTLEAWVRPTREDIEAIITQEDDAADEEKEEEPWAYSMLVGGEEAPKGWLRKGGESGHVGVSGGTPLPLNTWSHIAFVADGANLRFYVNGEFIGENSAIPLTAAEGSLAIGCLDNYGNFFKGRIDEVRIYDRALDEGEVAADRVTPIEE